MTWIGTLAMLIGLTNGFINGDFFVDGAQLFENPWGVMSLIDIYVGVLLFSLWIIYRESSKLIISLWIIAMIIFGFLAACIYLLIALYQSNDDWQFAFHGTKER